MFYDESWGHKTDKQCQCEFCTLVSAGFFYLFAVLSEGSGPYRLVVGYTPLTVAGSARQVATGIGIHLQRSIIITVTGNQFQLLSPTLQPTHGAVPPLGWAAPAEHKQTTLVASSVESRQRYQHERTRWQLGSPIYRQASKRRSRRRHVPLSVYTINLSDAITLGGAHGGSEASPVVYRSTGSRDRLRCGRLPTEAAA